MGDSWTSATPMRNSDFKALLTTPRTTPAGASGAQQQKDSSGTFKHPRPKAPADPDRDKKFKKPHPKRPGKPGQPGDKEKEGEEVQLYRDRAKERRDGLNIDFADAEQELAARGLGPTALKSLTIEQSKFLGGDIAHTHLVKGLDYALLNQERQKLQSGGSGGGSGGSAAAVAAAAAVAEATAAAQKQSVKFATPLGRSVYSAVFRPHKGNRALVREMFQPRRTAFVFEFGEGCSDVPTTLRRSKADCPAVQDVGSAVPDTGLLERVSKIMGYINQTSVKGGKRSARDSQYIRSILSGVNPAAPADGQAHGQLVLKGQAALTAPAAAQQQGLAAAGAGAAAAAAAAAGDVDDDDIFGEAGTDYAPALPQKKEGAGRRAEGLFENQDHQADMQLPPPPAGGGLLDGGEVDMDIEEGELPGQKQRQQQQQQQMMQGYPGYPVPAAAGDYYQPEQQAGWAQQGAWQQQQQQYGQAAYGQVAQPAQEQPKWRVSTKPGAAAAAASASSSALKGFADDAYAECFPTMADYGEVDDDEELDPKKAKAAEAAAAAAERGGSGKGGRGNKDGGGPAGGGMDDMDRKLKQKLGREVQQMQGIFKDKGWGNDAAFKKEDRLDAVAATPARKRLRI